MGFALHGVIDGYSRLIIFLQCSANNKAETAASLFEQTLEISGAPSRLGLTREKKKCVHMDKMIELISQAMEAEV